MPTLTQLTRDTDICWSTWRSPDGRSASNAILTPITPRQIEAWLGGADPPRPASVPATWLHKESRLERMFTNGRQTIEPNEIGDVGGYDENGARAPAHYVAMIQELGDNVVEVRLDPGDATTDVNGRVTTTREIEAVGTTKSGTVPTYRIVEGVATKVRER